MSAVFISFMKLVKLCNFVIDASLVVEVSDLSVIWCHLSYRILLLLKELDSTLNSLVCGFEKGGDWIDVGVIV